MLRTPRVRSSRCRRFLRRIRLKAIHGPFPLERCCERQGVAAVAAAASCGGYASTPSMALFRLSEAANAKPGFAKPTAWGSPEPLAGRSRRPSRPPFTARPLRSAIRAPLAAVARSRLRTAPRSSTLQRRRKPKAAANGPATHKTTPSTMRGLLSRRRNASGFRRLTGWHRRSRVTNP